MLAAIVSGISFSSDDPRFLDFSRVAMDWSESLHGKYTAFKLFLPSITPTALGHHP
jgi:hypothetical protein